MLMVIPDEGKLKWLYNAICTDGSDLEDFVVDLFQNNESVDDDSTQADFVIATFTGYVQASAPRANFAAPVISSHIATTQNYSYPNFVCSGGSPQTVYGWIMRGSASGIIYAGQNFDVPRVMSGGATEAVYPFVLAFKTFS
jgi:hypothetical protein